MSLPRRAMWRIGPRPSATTVAWKPSGKIRPSGSAASAGAATSRATEISKVFFMYFPNGRGLTAYFGAHARGAALPAPAEIAQSFHDGRTGAELPLALQPKKQ